MSLQDQALPKYSIAVAADLSGVPQQQIRRMEEGGLLTPLRTAGNTRRYSDKEVAHIGEIAELAEEGINREGIRRIFQLQEQMTALVAENADLRKLLAQAEAYGDRQSGKSAGGSRRNRNREQS